MAKTNINVTKQVQQAPVVEEQQVQAEAPVKEELVSGTLIEDTAQNEPTPQEAAGEVAPVAEITEPSQALSASEQVIADLLEKAETPAVRGFATALGNYLDAMGVTKAIPPEQGARHQVMFWRAIQAMINGGGKEFRMGWNAFLAVMQNEREGVFAERYMFRFVEQISIPKSDYDAFCSILNLAHVTADPKGRQLALKQVDMNKTLASGYNDEGRQALLSFYGL